MILGRLFFLKNNRAVRLTGFVASCLMTRVAARRWIAIYKALVEFIYEL